jgi:tRNA(His) 5'-end guanylyltransferase
MLPLGDRMKSYYEDRYRIKLTRRTPVIMRLDGKAFHTYTRKMDKPFSIPVHDCMISTSEGLLSGIQGARLVYTQSDEITIFIEDYDKLETDAWFDYNIQKMTSISAALASVIFNKKMFECAVDGLLVLPSNPALFDCRVFNIPKEEVMNVFYDRFLDCVRNSISSTAQKRFSSSALHEKSQADMLQMLADIGIIWNDVEDMWKYGTFLYKDDREIVRRSIDIREKENMDKLKSLCANWL